MSRCSKVQSFCIPENVICPCHLVLPEVYLLVLLKIFLSQIEPSIMQPRNLSGLEWVEGIGDETSVHLYKIIFFLLYVFFYIIMYILNIVKATKRCQLMKSKTLSLKTYIKELGFLKKGVIIQ